MGAEDTTRVNDEPEAAQPGAAASENEQAEAVANGSADTGDPANAHEEKDGATAQAEPGVNLMAELIAAQKAAKENMDGWQRARADFANYKKRVERDLQNSQQNATLELVTALLPIIDDFDRAMSNLPDDLKTHSWLDGVVLIQRKFKKLLDDNEIIIIDPVGEEFDPNQHAAIGTDSDSDMASGHVTVTLQKGYRYGERVLRPAMVRIAQ